jgi:hypothetical protein
MGKPVETIKQQFLPALKKNLPSDALCNIFALISLGFLPGFIIL